MTQIWNKFSLEYCNNTQKILDSSKTQKYQIYDEIKQNKQKY